MIIQYCLFKNLEIILFDDNYKKVENRIYKNNNKTKLNPQEVLSHLYAFSEERGYVICHSIMSTTIQGYLITAFKVRKKDEQ